MSTISSQFKKLAKHYSNAEIKYKHLKPVTLAQWMLESGFGTSKLATENFNFGGLKWRQELEGIAEKVQYEAHDGIDDYCKFDSFDNFIKGYWKFIERPPYAGWENHVTTDVEYIKYIGKIYSTSSLYADKVIDLIPEAEQLLTNTDKEATGRLSQQPNPVSGIYKVRFYTGDYRDRQMDANKDKAIAYVEHHFNSFESSLASYSVVTTGANASSTSLNWGRWYAHAIAQEFGTTVGGSGGLFVGGAQGKGDGNLRYTNMPAILLEPLFASNPQQADIIRSESGQTRLARVLVESIQRFFPDGGLIAFSVGHKYKKSKPRDMGAALAGGGMEATYSEKVLLIAKTILENIETPQTSRQIRVIKGNKELLNLVIDEDDELTWDPVRGLLQVIDHS